MAYSTELGYLEYDGASDRLSIPIRIRERHLDPETREVEIQAVGPELQITIWSKRDNIVIRVPLNKWYTDGYRTGTLTGANNGILAVGRYEGMIENDGDTVEVEVRAYDLERT